MFWVYILYSKSKGIFYKGQTRNLEKRLKRHNAGKSTFTKSGRPWKIVWATQKQSRSEAILLETKLKNLSHLRIIRFIEKYKENKHSNLSDKSKF